MNRIPLAEKLSAFHHKHFGNFPRVISFAPGRAEVLGNHTDYNQGTVLSTAIDRGHAFAISPNEGKGIRLLAGDLEEVVSFQLDKIEPVHGAGWASYVKGVFYYLKEKGLDIRDWDCSFLGNIPIGSGLSSSAALEVSSAFAAQEYCGRWLDPIETAKLCRESESRFAGCNCGLLDQFSSIFGKAHGLIHSDFRDLKVRTVALPVDVVFLILTPLEEHKLSESPYNARRISCEKAVRELNSVLPYPIESLRDLRPGDFERYKQQISPEAAIRAAHIVGEIERVALAEKALVENNLPAFGALMYQSHESSRMYFENSTPLLDRVVEIARETGALGARLSGGGWGGSLIALTLQKDVDALEEGIQQKARDAGITLQIMSIEPSPGAEIVKSETYK